MPERARPYRAGGGRRARDPRPSASSRGYDEQWKQARLSFLASHPLCVRCEQKGLFESAVVVDHIEPHCGDRTLFWDKANWQALCEVCHNRKSATEDRRR